MAPGKKKKAQTGSHYFRTTKKGELAEMKNNLNSSDKELIKEAVKKVIAAMTVGKDVSMLFTDVVKSMQTMDIELKKLVYLYIINYARSQPDKAILVVNTFQKDAENPSPLIRALAIRTMGCIRVDRITEYLCEPLRRALKDKDPYVRKTAAVCTAKLYDINAELVEEQDFIEQLRGMISDANPMVVANAVAALAEISEGSNKDVLQLNNNMLRKLLAALNECTEWGQVFILDMLAKYVPSAKEAEQIIERVSPRLSHANSAVSMSAIKVIMKYLDLCENADLVKTVLTTKLPPPLITLLSGSPPEIQFVAIRNINLIVQKRPDILAQEVKHFFCKYNDPLYVKMEKLELMIKLALGSNVDEVLLEFKEYAQEVDMEFARRAVRAIGRVAIKIDTAAEKCVKVLLSLIKLKANHVVQESVIVIKDIFRKYPNRYESIIATLCDNLESLDEPEAKASMIWIIGEYAARIDNSPELLESFVEGFQDESVHVQLKLLTAVVKLFLRRPDDAQTMVTQVLNMATESDDPDLRDRGYVYWRLLSTDPEAAQAVVLADKPHIEDDTDQLDPSVLDDLIANLATLASVYHKPPATFIKGAIDIRYTASHGDGKAASDDDTTDSSSEEEASEDEEEEDDKKEASGSEDEADEEQKQKPKTTEIDILGGLMGHLDMSSPQASPPSGTGGGGGGDDLDIFGIASPTSAALAQAAPVTNKKKVLDADNPKVKGLAVYAAFTRRNGGVFFDLTIENQTGTALNKFALKFNKNFFDVNPGGAVTLSSPIASGSSGDVSFDVKTSHAAGDATNKPNIIQCALKCQLGVAVFTATLPTYVLFSEDGNLGKKEFLSTWKNLGSLEEHLEMENAVRDVKSIESKLTPHNIFWIAVRTVAHKGDVCYICLKLNNMPVLLELTVGANSVQGCAKSENMLLAKVSLHAIKVLLKA